MGIFAIFPRFTKEIEAKLKELESESKILPKPMKLEQNPNHNSPMRKIHSAVDGMGFHH